MIEKLYKLYLQSSGVCIDTRAITPNCLFICIKGENFDGNSFAQEALKKGAAWVVVDNPVYATADDRMMLVEDSVKTLQELATFHRQQLNIPVIGITGTNGKTTTKELINAVLTKEYKVVATKGNLNNHIGVPLTLLSIKAEETQIAIVEMGANHPDEIAQLCQIAQPNYGVITNIGIAHMEGFGTFETIVKTKSALYQSVETVDGTLFVNADDELLMNLSKSCKRLTYGKKGDVLGKCNEKKMYMTFVLPQFSKHISMQLTGNYNFSNAMAAVAVGLHFGITIEDIVFALIAYHPQNNRSQIEEINGHTVIIDAYNANPSSMLVAITNLSLLKNEHKVLVVGAMMELGAISLKEHQKIVDIALSYNFEQCYFIGGDFVNVSAPEGHVFSSFESFATAFQSQLPSCATILIKGSRAMKMERVLDLLS